MSDVSGGLAGLDLDVAVIGSGFGGLYALKRLRDGLGLRAEGFDDAGGVGGTWYWNRYPGCRVDTEAHVYQYSFDPEMMAGWGWTERYPGQPEVLRYLNAVADRHDLKRSIHFDTRIVKAEWDEGEARWTLTTAAGERIRARFVIEGVGLLSSTKYPGFAGEETFRGRIVHAARWPAEGLELAGQRVAVIGTGSTGTQMMTAICDKVGHLYVMQRTPQYVVPLGNGPFPEAERARIAADPRGFRDWQLDTAAVFGFKEGTESALSLPPEEVARRYERAWAEGNGFAFMLKHFSDIITSPAANRTATDFVAAKIRSIVRDPAVAEKLIPKDFYAKRPLATDGYYEMFNRDNVTLVDVKEDPIEAVVPEGLRLASGRVVGVDVIVYATGFDAVSGNYLKIETVGRDGLRLADKWRDGPSALGGLAVAGFPNLFMIFGPFTPFTSQPLVHEWQVDWIAAAIAATLASGQRSIELEQGAEDAWVAGCDAVAAGTLFAVTDSWINGSNIAGKPRRNMFYMSGMASYMRDMGAIAASGYEGFRLRP